MKKVLLLAAIALLVGCDKVIHEVRIPVQPVAPVAALGR